MFLRNVCYIPTEYSDVISVKIRFFVTTAVITSEARDLVLQYVRFNKTFGIIMKDLSRSSTAAAAILC
jgi:hypothetical protein